MNFNFLGNDIVNSFEIEINHIKIKFILIEKFIRATICSKSWPNLI